MSRIIADASVSVCYSSRQATAVWKPVHSTRKQRLGCCRSGPEGFGSSTKEDKVQSPAPSTSSSSSTRDDELEALENRVRGNRKRRVEAKVQVSAPAVDLATGKTAPTPEAEFETKAVFALFAFFSAIMIEGLLLAAAGFLPEEQDQFIAKVVYPSFSPTVLLFLGASSLYGLWKTGKLPGQRQL